MSTVIEGSVVEGWLQKLQDVGPNDRDTMIELAHDMQRVLSEENERNDVVTKALLDAERSFQRIDEMTELYGADGAKACALGWLLRNVEARLRAHPGTNAFTLGFIDREKAKHKGT